MNKIDKGTNQGADSVRRRQSCSSRGHSLHTLRGASVAPVQVAVPLQVRKVAVRPALVSALRNRQQVEQLPLDWNKLQRLLMVAQSKYS
jgi:hypothetical protein